MKKQLYNPFFDTIEKTMENIFKNSKELNEHLDKLRNLKYGKS